VDPLSIDELKTRLLHARQDYREAKKTHKELRVKFLDTLSIKDRSCLLRTEKQRELGHLAKRISGKTQGQSVLTVLHNGEDLVTRTEVESALLQVNESKVRASKDTPFMQEPLSSAFGFTNSTQATQEVLQGTFQCPADVDKHARLLLENLQQVPMVPSPFQFAPRTHISLDDHIKGRKQAREKTSSGISGLHFGMFKAHLQVPALAALDASMRSVAYSTGYS
jgi:hypothetical protein